MRITIQKVENGYIVEDDFETKGKVVEENCDGESKERYGTVDEDKIAFSRLCELLAEEFGLLYDKFSSENLSVRWDKKGHKVD